MELNDNELRRYSRHLILPEVGTSGQKKIKASSVLCIGAGGLGSPAALYLTAAGVGRLGIVDFDRVDITNLQRQVLHGTPDVGRLKIESARETLRRLNPEVEIVTHAQKLSSENALDLIRPWDIVVDGTDNFSARYLANDACVMLGKPNVYGSIFRFEGQASLFAPHLGGPCYRCLFPEPPPPGMAPSCAEAGVLGVLPGIIGVIQAAEALKLALGCGESLLNRLLLFNALEMRFREIKLRQDPGCPMCGKNASIKKLTDYAAHCEIKMTTDEVTVQDLKRALETPGEKITVIDVREPDEYRLARIPGTQLLPLSQLSERYAELDPEQEYYLHCKAGVRSLKALHFLRAQGFKRLKSVSGGINAWSDEIDPSVPKY